MDFTITLLLVAAFLGLVVGLSLLVGFLFKRGARGAVLFVRMLFPKWAKESDRKKRAADLGVPQLGAESFAVFEKAMTEFGITRELGFEYHMGCYEKIYKLATPVGGVSEVRTLEGRVEFTEGNRCAIFTDGEAVTVLDRSLNRGIRFASPSKRLRSQLDGNILRLSIRRAGREEFWDSFAVDLHVGANKSLLPEGWPGISETYPGVSQFKEAPT